MASFNHARVSWLIVGAVCSCACSGGAHGEEGKGTLSEGADIASAPAEPACAAGEEQVFDLGSLDPAQSSEPSSASAINNHGTVVGTATLQVSPALSVQHAFRWKVGTGMVDLGTLGGSNSTAYDVNEADQVTGSAQLANGDTHAVVWDAEGRVRDLGTLGGSTSLGYGINKGGQVVGLADNAFGTEGFIWDAKAGMVALVQPGSGLIDPVEINDSGVVVGVGSGGPFKWTKEEGFTVLDAFGGFAVATAVNNLGDVAGYVIGGGGSFGVQWPACGGASRLASLPNGGESTPWAINDLGLMVGFDSPPITATQGNPDVAVQWDSKGIAALPLEAIASRAIDMNICGDVVGSRRIEGHDFRAYLWHPQRPARATQ